MPTSATGRGSPKKYFSGIAMNTSTSRPIPVTQAATR